MVPEEPSADRTLHRLLHLASCEAQRQTPQQLGLQFRGQGLDLGRSPRRILPAPVCHQTAGPEHG